MPGCTEDQDCASPGESCQSCRCKLRACTERRDKPGGIIVQDGATNFQWWNRSSEILVGHSAQLLCQDSFIYVSANGDRSRGASVQCVAASPRPRLVEQGGGRLRGCVPGCLTDCQCGSKDVCRGYKCVPGTCQVEDLHARVVSKDGIGPGAERVEIQCASGMVGRKKRDDKGFLALNLLVCSLPQVMRLNDGSVTSSIYARCTHTRDCGSSGGGASSRSVYLTTSSRQPVPRCEEGCVSNRDCGRGSRCDKGASKCVDRTRCDVGMRTAGERAEIVDVGQGQFQLRCLPGSR